MFLISNRVDRYENFNSIKLVNNIYLFYDCNCEFEFIGNNLVIGRQYQGVVSDKDGTYVEVELDNVDSGCIKFNRDFWGGGTIVLLQRWADCFR